MTGTDVATYTRERPRMSAFALEDGVVYHTYSTYSRRLDGLWVCTSGSTVALVANGAGGGHLTHSGRGRAFHCVL